jgi:hypothetical protein
VTGRPRTKVPGTSPSPALEDRWTREAVRLHGRYQREIVERFGLCPWAERARLDGRVRESVLLETGDAALAASLSVIETFADDLAADVVFLIFPRLGAAARDFDAFAARLRCADAQRHEIGRVPFVLAAFHPEAAPDTNDPERLIPFLRRTPDPTLQLVRASIVDAVRRGSQGTQFVDVGSLDAIVAGGGPVPLRERIARSNLATVKRFGVEVLEKHLEDIRRDRQATYASLMGARET